MLDKVLLFFPVWTALLLTALLALAGGFIVSLKLELRRLSADSVKRAELESAVEKLAAEREQASTRLSEEVNARLELVQTRCHELQARFEEAERERRVAAGWVAEPVSLNLNRRAQILSLHRKGRSVREIAAALQIPQGEVHLMVKVHDLSQSASFEVTSTSTL